MKKELYKKALLDFIIYTLIPIILFSIVYKLANMDGKLLILVSLLAIFFNLLYFLFRIYSVRNTKDYYTNFKELEGNYNKLENEYLDYKNSLEEYYINWIHQMKTPITALKLIVNGDEGVANLKVKNLINEEILYIEGYTGLALSYLKLKDDNKNLDFTYVKLHSIISEIIKRYRILFIQYGTKLNYSAIEDEVLTDPNWTKIMVEQILSNALKYSKGKEVSIYYNPEDKKLFIEDTGIGIRTQDINRIWDKGFSGLNGRINEESSGIGLFLVKNIGDRLNQNVGVTSTLGEGSKFYIQFNTENSDYKEN